MDNFYRLLNPGFGETYDGRSYRTFIEVEYKDGRLSITGVEGPIASGNAHGSCGQCTDALSESNLKQLTPGWTREMVTQLLECWGVWHLNDMQAGTPEQETAADAYRKGKNYPENDYTHICAHLESLGLLTVIDPRDPSKMYKYGSAWLTVDVPVEALEFLKSLPESSVPIPKNWGCRK